MPMLRLISAFRPHKQGLKKILGDLEADVINVIWDKNTEVTVREVYETMRLDREIAYTTVMSTMTHLAKKGILNQSKKEKAYVYTATLSKEEFRQKAASELVAGILDDLAGPVLTHLIGSLGEKENEKVTQQIEQLIHEMKRDEQIKKDER